MKHALPPDLAHYLSQYMDPNDVCAAELVTTDAQDNTPDITVYVSYIPRLRSFSAHRLGLGEVNASSLSELCSKLAELQPGVEIKLHLSKVARAEIARRRKRWWADSGGVVLTPGGRPRRRDTYCG